MQLLGINRSEKQKQVTKVGGGQEGMGWNVTQCPALSNAAPFSLKIDWAPAPAASRLDVEVLTVQMTFLI